MVVETRMVIPKQLQKREFRFCLLKKKEKVPFENKWQENGYAFDDPKLLKHIKNGSNYGVIGGYGNLRIIDCDKKEFAEKIGKVFNTFKVRTGSGGTHIYIISDYDTNHVFIDGNGELRAKNYQCVGPGSQHPNGMFYEVIKDTEIMEISKKGVELVLSPYLRKSGVESPLKANKTEDTDKSRSGREWAEVCRLIKKGITKEKVFENMQAFAKWSTASPQYKEMTYEKAKLRIEDSKIETISILIQNYVINVKYFYNIQPFFYDKTNTFWFWQNDKYKWEMVDDIDVMNSIDKNLNMSGQTISSSIKNNYIEAFKRIGRQYMPKEPPKGWLQFKDKVFDIKTKRTFEATPEYFFCNPIQKEIGKSDETPVMDKLFEEWVGKKYVQTLYEIIAYCSYPDYPIHLIFCLYGAGSNGKTKFQQLISRMIGNENMTSTELDTLLESRFESFKLYKKLVCVMGETNFGMLNKTSLLKKLTGQDLIGFEYKQKKPFDDYNYAKIIINSNSLPTTEDTSEGFYRRWFIIKFPNQFPEGKDILETIPDIEYNNLALKITKIIPELLEKGLFTNQGTLEERKQQYILASNPLKHFIDTACYRDFTVFMRYSELYTTYTHFLKKIKHRTISYREFSKVLVEEGLEVLKTTHKVDGEFVNGRFIEGVKLKENWEKEADMTIMPLCYTSQLIPPNEAMKWKVSHNGTTDTIIYEFLKTNPESSFKNIFDTLVSTGKDEIDEKGLDEILKKMKIQGQIFEPKTDKFMVI